VKVLVGERQQNLKHRLTQRQVAVGTKAVGHIYRPVLYRDAVDQSIVSNDARAESPVALATALAPDRTRPHLAAPGRTQPHPAAPGRTWPHPAAPSRTRALVDFLP
jgi:hypothetical protein